MTKTLQQKQAKLKAELAKISQQLTKEQRKADARKKILIGSFFLKQYKDPVKEISGFAAYLEKDQDRELFGLEPLPKKEPTNE